ncbi:hypothetical protein Nocox_39410 [Nonomuraea coxensis DSM 45129]|uniref:DUF4190 domain-containing protein n=1 Tax=Nonomuraea coxensis DSM 45129 TaxID=1122611 RepID=A0ABX8UFJ6_9ACTN|nr:DUF4190 domain-containing protein [Nonomuraea coxensis]QYC45429.1 hypothetical protein Nocox_39410 [Nonomuraea coxensis DSM 45129]
MTTSGDPNEPREGRRVPPREEEPDAPEPSREGPGPYEGEEPIAPVPPVVPPPHEPPHEPPPQPGPGPVGEPRHPDLPTSPETPSPSVGSGEERPRPGEDTEETQAFPVVPGATPAYPGWESSPGGSPGEEPPARPPTPSRYEQPPEEPQGPHFASPGAEPPAGGPPAGGPPAGGPSGGGPGGPRHPYGGYPAGGEGPPVAPPPQEAVPGTSPSSPYGGPPGYNPPSYGYPGAPYQYGGQPPPPDRTGNGLATASLVLGVASPFLVFVCFTGLITAILSIVFGCVALARKAGKGRAVAGIVISALSLILFAIVAIWFWNVVQDCAHLTGPAADRCLEERFPWMKGSRG